MRRFILRPLILLAGLMSGLLSAQAQPYPSKPVHIIVAYPAAARPT